MRGGTERFATVIVGAGQAGLAVSHELQQRGIEHVVLERGRVGQAWRARWDSLCMILPNWFNALPGYPYQGNDPDGFQSRDEWVADLEAYADRFMLPVRTGVTVSALRHLSDNTFCLETSAGSVEADNVVVATGGYQLPKIPAVAAGLSEDIYQLHSSGYSNPQAQPAGAVLVVGTGNSGSQIADELRRSGRQVYLSVGYSGFPLRRYRGRDVFWWYLHAKLEPLLRDREGPGGFANITGSDGGRALDLRQFSRDGTALVGHVKQIEGDRVFFEDDLGESLAAIDRRTDTFRRIVDDFVASNGIDGSVEERILGEAEWEYSTRDYFTQIGLREAGITSVIWATGFAWNLGWLELPVCDTAGAPLNSAGQSPVPGLYFAGMNIVEPRSTSIGLVGAEAARIAEDVATRVSHRTISKMQ